MIDLELQETIKHFAILDELETSSKLVRLGFGELQNLNQSNDFYFLPFQLLSHGFERLMKSYICLGYLNEKKQYPELKFVKSLGHDLDSLLNVILDKYFLTHDKPLLREDRLILSENSELRELLFILSEFGKLARYHNFDIITGHEKPSVNPKELWTKFENRILFANDATASKLLDWERHGEIYGELSRHIISIFEKFLASLSRQFFHGTLGEKGRQFSGAFSDFATLREFGKIDYRHNTTRFKESPKKVHKRTILDELNRKFNPNFKSKRIRKSEYNGEWPFYAEEVIVECRQKYWCIVSINGYDYALNGSAKGRYKLESPHDAGMAILGRHTADFTTIAFGLIK